MAKPMPGGGVAESLVDGAQGVDADHPAGEVGQRATAVARG
ncbi:hypothetical protein [Streptomyces antibioticus]